MDHLSVINNDGNFDINLNKVRDVLTGSNITNDNDNVLWGDYFYLARF